MAIIQSTDDFNKDHPSHLHYDNTIEKFVVTTIQRGNKVYLSFKTKVFVNKFLKDNKLKDNGLEQG